MKKWGLIGLLVVGALLTVGIAGFAEDPGPGCGVANCHAPGTTYTLAKEAMNVSGHPKVPDNATYDTCIKCHKSGTKLALGPILHKGHFHEGENHFTSNPENGCQSCHYVDLSTGEVHVQP